MDNVVTKDDIKKLATKAELKQVEKNVRGEILRVEERVENVEERMKRLEKKVDTVDGKLDKLQNTLDKFVGTVDELRTENGVGAHQIRELDKRVTKLESSSSAA